MDMKHFEYWHLPQDLQEISKVIHDTAISMDEKLEDGRQKAIGLQKLLEAKNCFVLAKIDEINKKDES